MSETTKTEHRSGGEKIKHTVWACEVFGCVDSRAQQLGIWIKLMNVNVGVGVVLYRA